MRSPLIKIYLGNDAGKEISSWVSKFDYEDTLSKDSKLTLSVFQANIDELLDEPVILNKGEIYFQFGYMESPMSDIHRCKIVNVDVDYAKTIMLTIVCMDKGNLMKKSSEKTVWKNQTTQQIAQQIAYRYNMDLEMSYEGKLWPSLPQGNRSDFELLQYMVAREDGGKYRVFIRDNTLYIAERGLAKNSVRTFTYRADQATQSFKVSWKESPKDAGSINGAAVNDANADPTKQTDTSTGEARVVIGDLLGQVAEALGIDSGGVVTRMDVPFTDPNTKKSVVVPTTNSEEAGNMAHGIQNAAVLKVLTATLTIEGDPLLRPDTMITMAGVHRVHAGNWYVNAVHQEITGHVYTTTLDLARNATKLGTVKADKTNNTKGADTQEDPRVTVGIVDGLGNALAKQYQDYSSPL